MTNDKFSFYKEHPKTCDADDFWGQVKRTVNGEPVSQEQIDMIIDAVVLGLELSEKDTLLDLCCGNGALSTLFFDRCQGGIGIDFSEYLVGIANDNFAKNGSREFFLGDVVDVKKIKKEALQEHIENLTAKYMSKGYSKETATNMANNKMNEFQKAYCMTEIAKEASGIDSAKAYDYASRAVSFFENKGDSLGIGKAYTTLGSVYFDYNEMRTAEKYEKKAKRIFELLMKQDSTPELQKLWVDVTLNLTASLGNQGKSVEEMQYLLDLAPVVKSIKDYKSSAIINSNLAIGFFNEEKQEKAYAYFNGNEINYEKTEAYPQYATDRLLFANCLLQMDSIQSAKNILDNSLTILNKIPESSTWQLYHQTLGVYYRETSKYDLAFAEFEKSENIIAKSKSSAHLSQQYLEYVTTYKQLGNIEKEKEYMLKYYDLNVDSNPSRSVYALKELAKIEDRAGTPKKAMEYVNRYFILNDSVQEEKLLEETFRLEQLYQKEKKDREIAELEILNDRTDLALEKKKSQNYLLYMLLGSLLFVLVSGYLTYRNRQKKALLTQKVQEQEIQRLKSEQERNLFGVMMEGVEQERKRLAADLHDGLGGRLSGISIKLSKLSEVEKIKKAAPELTGILENIDDSLQELRGVARNLMPETLFKYGLKAALEDYCSTLQDKDTKIVLQYYSTTEISDKNKELTLYRIIQELINNAIKHA